MGVVMVVLVEVVPMLLETAGMRVAQEVVVL